MLKKLIKYELVDMYKVLLIYYGLALVFSLLSRLFLSFDVAILTIIGQICNGIMISMFFSALITNIIRFVARFIATIYKDEAYLNHTLPTQKSDIYFSKIIVGMLSMITTIFVIFASIFIAYYSKENIEILKYFLTTALSTTKLSSLIPLILLVVIELLYLLTSGIIGTILGYNLEDKKLLKSIIIAIGIYFAGQVLLLLFFLLYALIDNSLFVIFKSSTITDFNILKTMCYIAIVVYSVLVLGINYLSFNIFKKGVNVE
ncbi:MAG: hypothetical protein IJW82_00385 [Clostridia bacterium]|nr:hypothetical protein [Clostridia bacterium]